MSPGPVLRVYLHHPLLHMARQDKLGFLNRMRRLLEARGWRVEIHPSGEAARRDAPTRDGYALFNMERPTHEAALTFRLAYHYPFWHLERTAERWRWPVAQADFHAGAADAADFAQRLRDRVLPGPRPTRGDYILIPLQGHIRKQRSFQAASPVRMIRAALRSGRPCIATLHPKESYDPADMAALARLSARHPNLTVGGDTMRLLRDCAFVVTQNSAVAFDGYILDKPAVLFGLVDFHHIALNVREWDEDRAIALAPDHRPDFAGYLDWFLRQNSLDMMAGDADQRMVSAMRTGGWPV